MNTPSGLPVSPAHALPRASRDTAWLIQSLWAHQAVGILAGHPKLGKSWLGLDMALSIASKTPCLGRFEPQVKGPVLIYLAEDALPQLRQRLEQIARHRKLKLNGLPLFVITAPRIRLDLQEDRERLQYTIEERRPLLLLLDPLVRLHAVDENDAMAIARLLGFLRDLQRTYELSILLVHHARKNGGAAGLAMRGSSDLWAWGDSNLGSSQNCVRYKRKVHPHHAGAMANRGPMRAGPLTADPSVPSPRASADARPTRVPHSHRAVVGRIPELQCHGHVDPPAANRLIGDPFVFPARRQIASAEVGHEAAA